MTIPKKPTPPPPDEPRPRGRPRDPGLVARVMEAAARCFCEQGFERASVESIAEASGVSKVTIYNYFPSKTALFEAAIASRVEKEFAEIDWARLDPEDPADALKRVGAAFLALMRSPDVISTHRTMYGTLGQETGAAETFFAAGPQKLVADVANYLRTADAAGSLAVPKPQRAADQFLSLFLGLGQIRALLGLTPPSRKDDDELLRENVAVFLRAHAPRGRAGARRS
jgi:AcrR family transcriptional regulator